jgi:phosphatidate cytidylyltransferase
MGIFSAVYYSSLIRVHHVTVGSVLQTVVNSLNTEEQLTLLHDLQRYLQGQGKVAAATGGAGTGAGSIGGAVARS